MLAALALLLALAVGGDERDRVVLKSGKEVRGRILLVDEQRVLLRRSGRDQEFPRADVTSTESVRDALSSLLEDARPAKLARVDELELLAARAEECGLAGEAESLRWRMLRLDPASEAAHTALGHRRRGGRFVVPLDGRQVGFDERVAAARDWGSAWNFRSLHYELRTNLPLEEALDLLLELERLYTFFFALLGPELGLREVCTPMRFHVHADRASYPEGAGGTGHYEPDIDTVVVDASNGLERLTWTHEATHQLLFVTAFRERGAQGEIPPWVNEGLAEYVATGMVGGPPLAFQAGLPCARHFRTQHEAAHAHDLKRVLSFSTTDFQAGSETLLKYAQSYALVHFLLHGEEGRHRRGFFDWLRLVYQGRGSTTELGKCLDTDWKPLERAWEAHVTREAR